MCHLANAPLWAAKGSVQLQNLPNEQIRISGSQHLWDLRFNWTFVSASRDVCSVSCFRYYLGKLGIMALRRLEEPFAKQRSALTQSYFKNLQSAEASSLAEKPAAGLDGHQSLALVPAAAPTPNPHHLPVPFTEHQPRAAGSPSPSPVCTPGPRPLTRGISLELRDTTR